MQAMVVFTTFLFCLTHQIYAAITGGGSSWPQPQPPSGPSWPQPQPPSGFPSWPQPQPPSGFPSWPQPQPPSGFPVWQPPPTVCLKCPSCLDFVQPPPICSCPLCPGCHCFDCNRAPQCLCPICPSCNCPVCTTTPCNTCPSCPNCTCPNCTPQVCVCPKCPSCPDCQTCPAPCTDQPPCPPCPPCLCPSCPQALCPPPVPCISAPPRDCADLYAQGQRLNGVYTIFIGSTARPIQVYCDMTTDGGGWTVMQRRLDGSANFYRTWSDYLLGFGNPSLEFWLGNENIHAITASKQHHIRIEIEDWIGNLRFAEYTDFRIAPACDNFRLLSVGVYCGNAGDSLSWHVGSNWYTYDRDNEFRCAASSYGAWWYFDRPTCHYSNLCGKYYTSPSTTSSNSCCWYYYNLNFLSLAYVEIKIRPDDVRP